MNGTTPPIIILGMHRSGTSLVSRMLEDMGLFVGWRKDVNNEAWLFLRLNEWLLRQCGGAWDNPMPIRHLLDNPPARQAALRYLRFQLTSPQAIRFLGPARYLRYRDVGRMNRLWGWKDPRNTFTLPLWLDLFPEARVIHVYRHGVDVAMSLQRRQGESVALAERRFRRQRLLHGLLPKRGGFAESLRCARLEEALGLWSEYMHSARAHVARLGDRVREVRYEDLLRNPGEELAALARFCRLPDSDTSLAQAAGRVRASRALAHEQDAALRELADRWRDELRPFGY